MNPMPSTGDSPIMDAWKKAMETYKKSLPEKAQKGIKMPTGPRDMVKNIEEWQLKQSKRKSIKVATAVGSGLATLQRFTDSIDLLAKEARCRDVCYGGHDLDKNCLFRKSRRS